MARTGYGVIFIRQIQHRNIQDGMFSILTFSTRRRRYGRNFGISYDSLFDPDYLRYAVNGYDTIFYFLFTLISYAYDRRAPAKGLVRQTYVYFVCTSAVLYSFRRRHNSAFERGP